MLSGLTVLIALVCVLLMAVVLIQNPKGGGIDSTFGGSANQMFGAARQADFIEKLTWGLGIALFALCIITAIYVAANSGAVAPTGGELPPLETTPGGN
ncbi:MAG: preprotein translocase subunit SecG [Bacteroidota bacterium]